MSLPCLKSSNSSYYIYNKIQTSSPPHKDHEIMSDHILHLSPSEFSVVAPTTYVFFPLLETVKLILALGIL